STRSTMVTAGSRAPSLTWLWRDLKTVRNASTACRHRSGRSVPPITIFLRRHRRGHWTLHPGWNVSSVVWGELSMVRIRLWPRSSPRHAIAGVKVNERQRLVLNRLLDGFQGKLTTSKYAKLAKCSQDTALRDILSLVERGILVRNPEGGRSTSYALAIVAPGIGS